MKTAIVVCAMALGASSFAQAPGPIMPGPPRFPAALRLYLELTDTQIDAITFLNAEYERFAQTKRRRMNQVQQEIAEETAREPLDPMALGLSYAELEASRRQLNAELARTRSRIRAVLSEPQSMKLKALEDVIKLLPIYSEAVQVNLLEPVAWGPAPVASGITSCFGVITSEPSGPRVNEP